MTKDEALKIALEALEMFRYHIANNYEINAAIVAAREALAQPEQETEAWPCLIAEADFSENIVILAMQCTDYKVSAGNHWLSNTPPQRTWVGLTDEERKNIMIECESTGDWAWELKAAQAIEAKLKEKNT